MTVKIFISYRRDDSSYAAGRLYDRLSQHFGLSSVFMDIDTIELGIDFVQKIEESVSSCDIFVAVIGRKWLQVKNDSGQRRLDDPNDFVRLEILTALNRNIYVIPALVDGAAMPRDIDLPTSMVSLSRRNGLEIGHQRFNDDANRLIRGIESILKTKSENQRITNDREEQTVRDVSKEPVITEKQTMATSGDIKSGQQSLNLKPLGVHFLFGFGLIYFNRKLQRGWIYPLSFFYSLIVGIGCSNYYPLGGFCIGDFSVQTFFGGIAIVILGFVDIFFAVYFRSKGIRKSFWKK